MSSNRDITQYGPPPPSIMNHYAMMNGLPQQSSQQSHDHNIQQQKQNAVNPQEMNPLFPQNTTLNNSYLNSSISKFMPPQAASTPSASPNPMHQASSNLNGPIANNRFTQNANIPAHLRPPGIGYTTPGTPPHLNGNSSTGNISSNSSRTASPSLQTSQASQGFPQQQQYQQHQLPPRSTVNNNNLSGLTNSMQNLNVNFPNGPKISGNSFAPTSSLQQQATFKGSAPDIVPTALTPLNANQNPIFASTSSSNNPISVASAKPTSGSLPPPLTSSGYQNQTSQAASQAVAKSGFPPSISTANSNMPMPPTMNNNYKPITSASNGIIGPQNGVFIFQASNSETSNMINTTTTTAAMSASNNANFPNQSFSNSRPMPPTSNSMQMPPNSGSMAMPPSSNSMQMQLTSNSMQMQPTSGSMAMPPSTNSMQKPPTIGSMAMPPSSNSMQKPPTSGSMAMPPTSNSMQMPPSSGSMAMPPTSNSMQMPPASNSMHMPPSSGSMALPPSSGSMTMPPTSNSMQKPPTSGSMAMPPASNSMQMPPSSGSMAIPPSSNSMQMPPSSGSMAMPPSSGSMAMPPSTNNVQMPPASGSMVMPPANNSMQMPPSRGSMAMPPSTNSMQMPPTSGSMAMPPSTNNMQMPPTSGNMAMPPSSNSMQMPPSRGSMAMPPSTNSMQMPPASGSMAMPPTSSSMAMPPSSNSMQMPPTSSSMSGPPSSNMMQMPPTNNSMQKSPSSGMTMPPTSSSSFMQMNAQQQQKQQQQQQQQQQPLQQFNHQTGGITQQKRIYPSTGQIPPQSNLGPTQTQPHLQQQQPQQQQQPPYSDAYQQNLKSQYQPPQSGSSVPGMFNGARNSGSLQYQNQMPYQQMQQGIAPTQYTQQSNIVQQGFSRLWGQDTIDLMQNRHIMARATLTPSKVVLQNQFHEAINCNPNIMRCTVAKIPESKSLLQKSRLPLGILIHPFRDINSLPVIQCPNIVRCRSCRTYINPFVYFVDSKMWKCNLCYRVNELPEDFQFDPATKTYGDVTRRPEVRSSTIEFVAPSEYMLRPPQPAIYLFLFDVSIIAQQCGYLEAVCSTLSKHLEDMPGDARTQIGFIAYNSCVHFYSMADGYNQPHEMTLIDIDDVFLPRPDNLLVNLKECKELIKDLLSQLPHRFAESHDPGSALGAALQIAYKLMQASGGRITVFQTCLPNKGPGSLEAREDPNNRSAKDVAHLNPATDFYKRYALECSSFQIAVDLFLLNQQYSDMATISGISKHSGGCVYHLPLYQKTKQHNVDSLKQSFKRYLTRKIGFEAVMRIRCTRGLQVHTFHGNFFVRSTDLLSLPNVNPDAGYGIQITYEESLNDAKTICFQAALLYTSSEGERRIRVHTLCLPVTNSLPEVMHSADTDAIIGILSKMAVDRSLNSNISDAREAFINATVDILNAFKIAQNLPSGQTGQLIAPRSLALMPLYILALLKHPAFRVGTSTRLDDRVHSMDLMKTLPLDQLMKYIYPEFYNIDSLLYHAQTVVNNEDDEDEELSVLPEVPRLQLSAEHLDSRSVFLMDCGNIVIIYVGLNVPVNILENTLGIKSTAELPDYYYGLPNVNSSENNILRRFIMKLNDDKPFSPKIQIMRDTSTAKPLFVEKLVDDRSESSLSYYEFLQHIRTQVK